MPDSPKFLDSCEGLQFISALCAAGEETEMNQCRETKLKEINYAICCQNANERKIKMRHEYLNYASSVLTLGTVRYIRLIHYTVRHHFRIRSHYSFSTISLSRIDIACAYVHRSCNEKGSCTRTGNVYNIPKLQRQAWFILP